ncbi:LysR family transcriptional regulator [Rhodoplanes sp.]|uniref:LysR family transcriptional regulator n=1 Tax=Rhodoplanes sp. TaxID=1968906 RepID=UPI0025DE0F1F|nr:LysR family transcriptional regulator [Rhodoplanes sp.]
MELRHLRYFVVVAEESHITRAAERLGMQQPPLSQQMKALERELGVQLLRRRPRGVELTAAGRSFLADARAVLAQAEHAVAGARRTARGEQGQVCIGFTSSAPFHPLVPRVIRAFREAFPRVAATLEEGGTLELVADLQNETVDVGFVRTPVDAEGLVVHPLLDEPMVVALPRGHLLAQGRANGPPLALKALAGETFILYRRRSGPGLYDAIIAACRAAGFSPTVGQEVPRIVSTLNLVAAGLGLSLVPESLGRMQMDGVVYRRLQGRAQPTAPLLLVARRGDPSGTVRQFLSLARRAAKDFAPDVAPVMPSPVTSRRRK